MFNRLLRRRRVLLEKQVRKADPRGDIVLVALQGDLERLQSLVHLVLFEEELAPGGVDHRVIRHQSVGVTEEPVRILEQLAGGCLTRQRDSGAGETKVFSRSARLQIENAA